MTQRQAKATAKSLNDILAIPCTVVEDSATMTSLMKQNKEQLTLITLGHGQFLVQVTKSKQNMVEEIVKSLKGKSYTVKESTKNIIIEIN